MLYEVFFKFFFVVDVFHYSTPKSLIFILCFKVFKVLISLNHPPEIEQANFVSVV